MYNNDGTLTVYGEEVLAEEQRLARQYEKKYGAPTMLANMKNPHGKASKMGNLKNIRDKRIRGIVRLLKMGKSHSCTCDELIIRTGISGGEHTAILALLSEIDNELEKSTKEVI